METLVLREGQILIKVIPPQKKGKIILVEDNSVKDQFRMGVVQSIGYMHPSVTGFIEGDTVVFGRAVRSYGDCLLVNLDEVVFVCNKS